MTDDRLDDVMAAADLSVTTHPRQPAGITWLARALLAGAIGLVAVAVLLPNTWLAELRLRWRWFSEAINRVEALWPALDMVHVLMFAAVGVLAALAFPAWSRWRLLMAITTLAVVSEFVQIWVPGRTASVGEALLDVMAGALGLLLAGALARLAGWRSPRDRPPSPPTPT